MKILYLPIFEGGRVHEIAVTQKRGLYNALVNAGHQVFEFDYLERQRNGNLAAELEFLVSVYQPDLLLSQLHGADPVTPAMLANLRALHPNLRVVNWSGDSHRHSLLGEGMQALCQHFDLLLVPTLDVLPDLEAAGIHARYWNIALEPPVTPLPDVPKHDVVFLGNVFNDQRRALVEMLRSLEGVNVGIYGDWEHADGDNVYNFAAQHALYQNATLAIADNYRPDNLNYVSDRPMQIMAAGGALCLHQRVDTMIELTGWVANEHYAEWLDLDELQVLIRRWLRGGELLDRRREEIRNAAYVQVLECHTWGKRVDTLFNEYLIECGIIAL